jgi:putative ABC transport system permease protein
MTGGAALFWRYFTLRHWRRSPGSHAVLVVLLGVGVAAFLGIRLANRSATAGFEVFTETLGAGAPVTVESTAGAIPVDQLRGIRAAFGIRSVVLLPSVQTSVRLGDGSVDLVGIDVVAVRNLAGAAGDDVSLVPRTDAESAVFQDALRGEPVLLISPTAARRFGLSVGDALTLGSDAGEFAWRVGFVLPEALDRGSAIFLGDLRTVQERTGREGAVDRVDVFPMPGVDMGESVRTAVQAVLPPGLLLSTPGERQSVSQTLSAAFRMNLSALSMLALLVSLYLILQSLDAAVVRRREEIAVLRSLGVRAEQIKAAWMLEAMTLGIAGSAAGILMGVLLARVSVGAVTETLGNLYVQGQSRGALWSGREVLTAFGLGVGASLLAGWLPARDAAMTPPAQSLGRGGRALPIQLLDHPLYAVLALGAGAVCLRFPPLLLAGGVRFPLFGYLGATAFAVGMSILVCLLPPWVAKGVQNLRREDAMLRLAASQLRRLSGRHKLALAGLMIATAMSGGISLLVHSFRGTVTQWLDGQLEADLFISAKGFQHPGSPVRIPAESRALLLSHASVADAEYALMQRIRYAGQSAVLVGLSARREGSERIWLQRPAEGLAVLRERGDRVPVLVSEPWLRRFGTGVGDVVRIEAGGRVLDGVIRGVFADYANEHGSVVADAEVVAAFLGEDRTATLGLFLKNGENARAVRDELQAAFPALNLRDQRALREEVFTIFQQTFSVTAALKFIGVAVAVAGLLLSQISLFLERRGELRVLKELGCGRRELGTAGAWESGILALTGGAAGLLTSLGLGWILIYVINRQAFGWTLRYAVPAGSFAGFLIAIVAAGALAGGISGRKAASLPVENEE